MSKDEELILLRAKVKVLKLEILEMKKIMNKNVSASPQIPFFSKIITYGNRVFKR